MTRKVIKDATGCLLGSIDYGSANGAERAYDSQGHILGSFDPQNDPTKTATGTLLTKGNTLAGLILKKCG